MISTMLLTATAERATKAFVATSEHTRIATVYVRKHGLQIKISERAQGRIRDVTYLIPYDQLNEDSGSKWPTVEATFAKLEAELDR